MYEAQKPIVVMFGFMLLGLKLSQGPATHGPHKAGADGTQSAAIDGTRSAATDGT
jgi:hypothetical protein